MSYNEILINRMFAGTYLEEGDNIGHEVINLIKDDDGSNYLYITDSGTIQDYHHVDSVLLVSRLKGKHTFEVIALATGLSEAREEEVARLTYAEVPLADIFAQNTYHGGEDSSIRATFKAKRVRAPRKRGGKSRVVITTDEGYDQPDAEVICLKLGSSCLVGQNPRRYFSPTDKPEAYLKLKELVDNERIWEESDLSRKLALRPVDDSHPMFLEVIRKEYDELVFSNLLAHFFGRRPLVFKAFACDYLGFAEFGEDPAFVRESKGNIDLWVEDELGNAVVIENKLRSGVNGDQLKRYYEAASKHVKDTAGRFECAILVPDYNDIDLLKHEKGGAYKKIRYSDLLAFFRTHEGEFTDEPYFEDFLVGLELHTKSAPERYRDTMMSRFRKMAMRASVPPSEGLAVRE